MPNKKIYLIIAFIVLLILVALLIVFINRDKTETQNMISVEALNGGQVNVSDFKKKAVQNDEAAWTLQHKETSAVIMYNENSDIFTILINANEEQEFKDKRVLAEQEFLELLDVVKEEACAMKVIVAINGPETDLLWFSHPQRLSFCQ